MSAARHFRPHYTIADYRQWPGDWELWFGTAVAMTPSPFAPHERVISELAFQLQSAIKSQKCECCLYTGLDWIVQNDTVVRPDIMIVCGNQPTEHLEQAPCLVVEVLSPSTVEKDWGAKRDLYQQHRVPHYLIIDPDTSRLHWLRLINDEYAEQPPSAELLLRLHTGCELGIHWPSN